jgi:branched-chain amino acid transport system substrate-binding protein
LIADFLKAPGEPLSQIKWLFLGPWWEEKMTRKPRPSFTSLLLAAALLIAAALPAAAQIKIGFIATLSGSQGGVGQDQYDGFMLGIEHSGGTLGGQAVTVIKEDDQLKPDVGLQLAQKLIEKERVPIITGIGYSNVMMAVHKPITDAGVFLIGTNAGPSPIAGARCSAFFFSTSYQNDQPHGASGKYATDQGYKRMIIMAPNYQAGKDVVNGFKRYYKGEVLDEVYTQLNQQDYSAEIAQLQLHKPDAVFVFAPGALGINFIKQFQQAGLLGKYPLLVAGAIDGINLPAMGETALGVMVGTHWGPDMDNPVSKKFVMDFNKKHGRVPSQYAQQGYDAALLLDSAIHKVGGDLSDKEKFRAALKGADFKSSRGYFAFNNNQFPIQDFYEFEVVKDNKGRVDLVTRTKIFTAHKDAYAQECPLK